MTSPMATQVVCRHCGVINRVANAKLADKPICGKCKLKLLTGEPIVANDGNFQRFVDHTGLPIVVDFWAPWCGPCQQFAPVFTDTAAALNDKALFIKLDTEANQHTAARFQIRSIPTLMVFRQGQEQTRLSGALPKMQFQQWLREQGIAV